MPLRHAGPVNVPESPTALAAALRSTGYLADEGLATARYLALRMGRPLFCEGEPGTGKTALAQALAEVPGAELIRLQCHEGIDASQALYDWDFPRQLLHLRAAGGGGRARPVATSTPSRPPSTTAGSCSPARSCARCETTPAVLLVDEIDRADDEFEAFLLEVLAEHAVTIPEIGEVRADDAAAGGAHLQPHPRGARRPQAPLPLPLARPPRRRPRDRDPARAAARAARPAGHARSRVAVRKLRGADLLKPPGRRRDARLGARAAARRGHATSTSTARPPRSAPSSSTARTPTGCATGSTSCGFVTMPCGRTPDADRPRFVGFTAVLRGRGLPVTADRVAAFLAALDELDVTSRWQTYWAGRLTLCADPDDLHRYDQAFEEWFAERGSGGTKSPTSASRRPELASLAPLDAGEGGEDGDSDVTDDPRRAPRRDEVLRHRDLADLHRRRARAPAQAARAAAARPPTRPSRRRARPATVRADPRPHAARGAAQRRRGARAAAPRPAATAAQDRAARRRLRVDGALRRRAAAVRARRHAALARAPSRPSPSAPGSPASPASCGCATPTTRCTRRARPSPTGRAAPGWARCCGRSSTVGDSGERRARAVVVVFSDGWERGEPDCSVSRWPGSDGWPTGSSG